MNCAYLLLGGNQGNRSENLENAMKQIETFAGPISKKSKIYVTAAWGNTAQPDFYNQVISIQTQLTCPLLLIELLSIEQRLGRKRTETKWQQRTIDLDILFFNDEIIDLPELKVPHPFIQMRKFTLIPLVEIAPELKHPLLKQTVKQLLEACADNLEVKELVE